MGRETRENLLWWWFTPGEDHPGLQERCKKADCTLSCAEQNCVGGAANHVIPKAQVKTHCCCSKGTRKICFPTQWSPCQPFGHPGPVPDDPRWSLSGDASAGERLQIQMKLVPLPAPSHSLPAVPCGLVTNRPCRYWSVAWNSCSTG